MASAIEVLSNKSKNRLIAEIMEPEIHADSIYASDGSYIGLDSPERAWRAGSFSVTGGVIQRWKPKDFVSNSESAIEAFTSICGEEIVINRVNADDRGFIWKAFVSGNNPARHYSSSGESAAEAVTNLILEIEFDGGY